VYENNREKNKIFSVKNNFVERKKKNIVDKNFDNELINLERKNYVIIEIGSRK
jgi:hypothetical protein